MTKPTVHAKSLPAPKNQYVCWLDVMGSGSILSLSLAKASNFILKFHGAVLLSKTASITLYPVMDGVYVTADKRKDMVDFLVAVYGVLAQMFVSEKHNLHRFMIRGALAYGPVVHGTDVSANAWPQSTVDAGYSSDLLLGIPMIQAHESERLAAPYGIYIHESARAFSPTGEIPFPCAHWRWHSEIPSPLPAHIKKLGSELEAYFTWCAAHTEEILYRSDRIAAHAALVKQVFSVI